MRRDHRREDARRARGRSAPPAASRQSLEANATYPLVREGTVASKSGMPNMPDFTFLRTRGFRERAFGDVVLEDTRGTVGGEVEKTADDVGNAVENAVGNAGNALPASSSSFTPPPPPQRRRGYARRGAPNAARYFGAVRTPVTVRASGRTARARARFLRRARIRRSRRRRGGNFVRRRVDASVRGSARGDGRGPRGWLRGFPRASGVRAWTRSRGVVVVAGVGPDPRGSFDSRPIPS